MTENKNTIIVEAQSAAENTSCVGWFFVGFFLGFIGLLIAYLRSPDVPTILIMKLEGDDRYIFEKSYTENLKSKQVSNTWFGFIVSFVIVLIWLAW